MSYTGRTLLLVDAPTTLSAVSLGIALLNGLGWVVERRDRKAEVAGERRTREAALELERKRFEAEIADREARKKAQITAEQGGRASRGDDRWTLDFRVKNLGPSWAKHVRVWLVEPDDKAEISVGGEVGPLDPHQEAFASLSIPRRFRDERRPVELWTYWGDEAGEHTERINIDVRLDY